MKIFKRKKNGKKKYKYFYFVASFMRSDKEGMIQKVDFSVSTDLEKFPLMSAIRCVEDYYNSVAVARTIHIDNVLEITKGDYEALLEHRHYERYKPKAHGSDEE